MNWYRVTKTIRGRKYDYWQKTYRVGRSVKTLNKYIGPAGSAAGSAPTVSLSSASHDYTINKNPDGTYSFTGADHSFQFGDFYKAEKHRVELMRAFESVDNKTMHAKIEEAKADSLWSNTSGDTYWKEAKRQASTTTEPIVRMGDLSPKQQKKYMSESLKKIKADHAEADSEENKHDRANQRYLAKSYRTHAQKNESKLYRARKAYNRKPAFLRLFAFKERNKLNELEQTKEWYARKYEWYIGKKLRLRKPYKRRK
jgi:polyhydroxyalkanoate synthesis regulator phasin